MPDTPPAGRPWRDHVAAWSPEARDVWTALVDAFEAKGVASKASEALAYCLVRRAAEAPPAAPAA